MTHDYSEFTKPQSEDALARLSVMADEQLQKQLDVAVATKALKDAKEELDQVSMFDIPELMAELGIEEFQTTSGLKVSIKEKVRASILKATQIQAFMWLRENGHAAIIKRIVKVQFGMGEDEMAQKAIETLLKQALPVEDNSSVHPSTLAKFVREMFENGAEVPEELFSVHRQRVAGIKTS